MSVKIRNVAAMPIDAEQIYAEDLNVTASGVLGSPVDMKGYGFGKGTLVLDIAVSDDTTGDELYDIVHELSDDLAFTVPVEDITITLVPGELGRKLEPINNQIGGVMYRYSRLRAVLAGTTPILTGTYFLGESINPNRG